MNIEELLSYFNNISEAPDAIPTLRRFIIELAVRGRLVEQDRNDEPASELLQRIKSQKMRMIETGEIKQSDTLAIVDEEEKPFEVPESWSWVRLGSITSYIQRGRSPKYAPIDGLPVVSQKCVQWSGLNLEFARSITEESLKKYEAVRFLRDGDLLWNSTGTGTIGRVVKVSDPPFQLVCDSHVTVVRCLEANPEYVRSWLRSDQVYGSIEARASGSTNQIELTSQMAVNQLVPLPPLAEQNRIVSKVEELMIVCDELESARTEREKQKEQLLNASLQRLIESSEPSFSEYARFYLNQFAHIATRPEHIHSLRQTIFDLAVRGKLVQQDADDESASELLKQIQAKRMAGLDFKSTMKQLSLLSEEAVETPPHFQESTEDMPLSYPEQSSPHDNLPISWCWAHMEDWFFISGGIQKTPNRVPRSNSYPYVGVRNVQRGRIDLSEVKLFELYEGDLEKFGLAKGDILIVEGNGSENEIGRCAVWSEEIANCVHQNHIIRCRPLDSDLVPYTLIFLNSPKGIKEMKSLAVTTSGLYNLSVGKIRTFQIPLPPLAEQKRIVAKVEELMILCEQLENELISAQKQSRELLVSLFNETLGIKLYQVDEQEFKGDKRNTRQKKEMDVNNTEGKMTLTDNLPYSPSNPVRTINQLAECVDALGGTATPERLLNIAGLSNDIDTFFHLLREGRDQALLHVPIGSDQIIRRVSDAN